MLDARVAAQDDVFALTTLVTRAGALRVPRIALPLGATLRLQVPARDVSLSRDAPTRASTLNVLPAVVVEIRAPGEGAATVDVRLDCGGAALLARITRFSMVEMGLGPGDAVFAVVKGVALDAAPETGRRAPG